MWIISLYEDLQGK